MTKKATYWLCQLLGWSGMIVIEISNYTLFIIKRFEAEILIQLIYGGLMGFAITHFYRYLLKRIGFFNEPKKGIWLFAMLSTICISICMTLLTFLPSFFSAGQDDESPVNAIVFIGFTYNWGRYVGVWVIIYFMYKLQQQNHSIQKEKLLVENKIKTAELELLKAQLNPHFLFNALNSIKALVSLNPEQSRDAIVKLSELLRFTLQYHKEQEIPLEEELTEVKKYLELEQLRFGDRLQVEWDIKKPDKTCVIPPAMLLTMAENAVKHGIGQSSKQGIIRIESCCKDDLLTLTMRNTGQYAPAERVGIGLKQINTRLEVLYKNMASFCIENKDNTVVSTLKIPQ